MHLIFNSHFDTKYKLLSRKQQQLVDIAIELFIENPNDPNLAAHPLRDELQWYYAFSADTDIRILYTKKGDYVSVTMIKVGSHESVYTTPIF
jgi:mRNA-degrading endonuclease YafQ of YafQ-DinJ toxin-antitoxin module